jgi:hypothetical protein
MNYITVIIGNKTNVSAIKSLDALNSFEKVDGTHPIFLKYSDGANHRIDSAEISIEMYQRLREEYLNANTKNPNPKTLDLISRTDAALESQNP